MRRSLLFFGATLIASAVGYGASTVADSGPRPLKFHFSQVVGTGTASFSSSAQILGQNQPFPVGYCNWPNGRTSISVSEAKRLSCKPLGDGTFAVPRPGGYSFLLSPVDDAPVEPQDTYLSSSIRIVERPASGDVMKVSPVLVSYGDYSGGSRPSIVLAEGSLWIFDVQTSNAQNTDSAELLRLDPTTGAVLQRTAMPAISRPLWAVNATGYWIATAGNSLSYAPGTVNGVWFAQNGAKTAQLVRATDFGDVLGLRAEGAAMDVFVGPTTDGHPAQKFWRFTPIAG